MTELPWSLIVEGDTITYAGRSARIMRIDARVADLYAPDLKRTITVPIPAPSDRFHLVAGADPANDTADLREIAHLTGCTLSEAADMVVRVYLGAVKLGTELRPGYWSVEPWDALDRREQAAHLAYFHPGETGHDDASPGHADHVHR